MKKRSILASAVLLLSLQACSQQQVANGVIGAAKLPVKAGAAVVGTAATAAGSAAGGIAGSAAGPVGSAVGSAVGGAVGGAIVPSF